MVGSATLRVGATVGALTHILTFGHVVLFPTEGRGRTVRVGETVNWGFTTVSVGVAHRAGRTQALVVTTEVVAAGACPTWVLNTEVNGLTSLEWVTLETITAEAHSLMGLRDAQSILPALVVDTTCRLAHVVVTTFVLIAVIVLITLYFLAPTAFILRITKVALGTLAHRLVVDGHTLGVATTEREAVAGFLTLSLAYGVGAALFPGVAVGVASTLHLRYADAVLTHLEVWTISGGAAGGDARALQTHLSSQATSVTGARRDADSSTALLPCRAVRLDGAVGDGCAAKVGVPGEASLAEALMEMGLWGAAGVLAAHASDGTRIDTPVGYARHVRGTLIVAQTLEGGAAG